MAIEIREHVAEAKQNVYAEDVAALAEAGEGVVGAITVNAERVKTEKVKFQRAANDAGFTARVVSTTELEDGSVEIAFRLKDRETRPGRAGSAGA